MINSLDLPPEARQRGWSRPFDPGISAAGEAMTVARTAATTVVIAKRILKVKMRLGKTGVDIYYSFTQELCRGLFE